MSVTMSVRHGVPVVAALLAMAACGDDETTAGATTSPTGAGGAAGQGGGAGGSGGQGGGGGACQTCSELVANNAPPTAACPGESTTLIGALVTCLCKPEVCGGMGKGCYAACTMMATPDAACLACDQMAFAGACKTEGDACLADQP